jgi:hypothetical protein
MDHNELNMIRAALVALSTTTRQLAYPILPTTHVDMMVVMSRQYIRVLSNTYQEVVLRYDINTGELSYCAAYFSDRMEFRLSDILGRLIHIASGAIEEIWMQRSTRKSRKLLNDLYRRGNHLLCALHGQPTRTVDGYRLVGVPLGWHLLNSDGQVLSLVTPRMVINASDSLYTAHYTEARVGQVTDQLRDTFKKWEDEVYQDHRRIQKLLVPVFEYMQLYGILDIETEITGHQLKLNIQYGRLVVTTPTGTFTVDPEASRVRDFSRDVALYITENKTLERLAELILQGNAIKTQEKVN